MQKTVQRIIQVVNFKRLILTRFFSIFYVYKKTPKVDIFLWNVVYLFNFTNCILVNVNRFKWKHLKYEIVKKGNENAIFLFFL